MSTYYSFACKKCKKQGGFFSRKAWGWGNADIIASFRFIMKHTSECGHNNIRVLCEYDEEGYRNDNSEELLNYFPCSDDWEKKTSELEYEKYLKAKGLKDLK